MNPAAVLALIIIGTCVLAKLIQVITQKEVDNNGLIFTHDLRKR